MAALAAVALLALVYWVAKPPNETVTGLPSADGHIGTVVVQRGNEKQALNHPNATTRNGDTVEVLAATDVKETFGSTLQALPPRPTISLHSFVTVTHEPTDESKG